MLVVLKMGFAIEKMEPEFAGPTRERSFMVELEKGDMLKPGGVEEPRELSFICAVLRYAFRRRCFAVISHCSVIIDLYTDGQRLAEPSQGMTYKCNHCLVRSCFSRSLFFPHYLVVVTVEKNRVFDLFTLKEELPDLEAFDRGDFAVIAQLPSKHQNRLLCVRKNTSCAHFHCRWYFQNPASTIVQIAPEWQRYESVHSGM
jgi:hypothetical protein